MNKYNFKRTFVFIITLLIITGLLAYGSLVLRGKNYYLVSMAIVMTGLICAVINFEHKKPSAGYLTGIVVFTVIAVGSRCLFAAFPQVKPIAAIVILSGIAMGREAGFMTGALAMFLSNFYFLQGAWTPYQMVGMGLVGYIAGVLFYQVEPDTSYEKNNDIVDDNNDNEYNIDKINNKSNITDYKKYGFRKRKNLNHSLPKTLLISLYGFLSVIVIYGLIVDINTLYFSLGDEPTTEGVITVYLAGLPFDIILAVTTAVMLVLIEPPVMRRWQRISRRYEINS